MKKKIDVGPVLFPMPTYMIGTYTEDGSPDLMMMAWGGICDSGRVALNLEESHKTVANLRARGAFTLAVPGTDTLKESDYLGTVSANESPDKVAKAGLHTAKSELVDAPVVEEYPLTLECEVERFEEEPYGLRILGKIVGIQADESVLGPDGKIDSEKLHAFLYDPSANGYYAVGGKVGTAWASGAEFMEE